MSVHDSVYAPLYEHLLYSGKDTVSMSFREVEAILGRALPKSARVRPEWWSNNAAGHVQAQAWRMASYRKEELDLVGERVTFVLDLPQGGGLMEAKQAVYEAAGKQPPAEYEPTSTKRSHPAFGSLKGTTIVMPGYDLTAPTSLLLSDTDAD